jgi:hypothetical protein
MGNGQQRARSAIRPPPDRPRCATTAPCCCSLFNEERLIWEYQVEQLTDSHFRVALLAAPACDRQAAQQRVVDRLAAVLGSGVRIDVEFVDSIDRTVGGKFAPVISRRARQRRAAGG